MSWMQKLYETYDRCAGKEADGAEKLMPIAHTMQKAQIEIVLDGAGRFRRASVIADGDANTMIPCTEQSGGRAGSKPTSHPLSDKLQYVAGDYLEFGGEVTSGFAAQPEVPHQDFLKQIRKWNGQLQNEKLAAITTYVEAGCVVKDLIDSGLLPIDPGGKLLKIWEGESQAPEIFKVIQKGQAPEDAFVRWRVEARPGDPVTGTWEDSDLVASWVEQYQNRESFSGCCMVTGLQLPLAIQHPAKLRHGGDKAKLISSNDTSGYTFRGKFLEADEAATVAFEVTQKAHNALRWLIKNQAYRNGDQVFVSWAISGKPLPPPFEDTRSLFADIFGEQSSSESVSSDTAQAFATNLAKAIAGYGARLDATEDIVMMGLDSATPGRMGITFYRELKGSEFLERLETWHRQLAWPQNFGKEAKFLGAPAPRDIAEAAYGRRLDDKLRKATVERLLPCIVDGIVVPLDLVQSTFHRAANRVGLDRWEWEKVLGIACSLFKGHHIERRYQMALETERTNRDYLFGRLLAIAENIESYALSLSSEKRETTATRFMQRFADRPCSTWRTIELSLRPYIARLRSNGREGFVVIRLRLIDEIMSSFEGNSFIDDTRLTGEFLLGYHCQREALKHGKAVVEEEAVATAS